MLPLILSCLRHVKAGRPGVQDLSHQDSCCAYLSIFCQPNSALSRIKDSDKLLADGLNYGVWHEFLSELAHKFLSDAKWYTKVSTSSDKEKIGRAILFGAVNRNLHRTLSHMPDSKAHDMYNHLQKRLWVSSRAQQQNLWRKMLDFKLSDYSCTSTAIGAAADIIEELEGCDFKLIKDEILAMTLQCGTEQGSVIQQEVNRRVENYFHTQQTYNVPCPTVRSDYIILTLDAVKQHVTTTSQKQEATSPPLISSILSTSMVQPVNLAATNSKEVAGLAAQPRLCWECRLLDHFANKCPTLLHTRNSQNQQPMGTTRPPTVPHHGGFQGFYPILAPPGIARTCHTLNFRLSFEPNTASNSLRFLNQTSTYQIDAQNSTNELE
ncbi:hypothetical protein VP01_2341g3 [Puccinia sorghi]|uniref:CCHC-type domain-containing protein n=1 Tax=Puccinia sorghi TaxID=27349 RepID=A0A0L6V7B2_9BASI|nr:hypothetical protein VP01_2341g3 [Puccinia sorghi]